MLYSATPAPRFRVWGFRLYFAPPPLPTLPNENSNPYLVQGSVDCGGGGGGGGQGLCTLAPKP